MKSGNLDDIIKKKKTSNTSFYFKIAVIVFAMLALFFIPFTISNMIRSDNKSYEIKTNGEQYGKSNFFKYQGKVYVISLNDGMQELENVDIVTFKAFEPEDYFTQNIALDKNSVYFGNVIIPDLNPNKLEVLGNGYYTDGTNTYFYSPFSELDKDSSKYIYPYKKMENIKNLKALKDFELFALDGDNGHYKGEILKNVDLNTLEIIDRNNEYFSDKKNVYYKSKLLPIKNSGELKIVSTKQGNRVLYDEANGYVFIEDYSFDREKAPYKVLGNGGNHLYDLFFVAKDGIYFYNTQKKKQERIGDNIFSGNIEELTPNVFTDDKNIYYFDTYDVWFKGKNTGHILTSKNTIIYYLDKKDNWEKVSDIRDGTVVGTIWKKGNDYYYFDEFYMKNTIYQIADKETLNYLLNANNINHDNMVNLVENKKLIVVNGEEKIRATTELSGVYRFVIKYSKIFIFILIAISGIFRLYKNSKKNKKITEIIKK